MFVRVLICWVISVIVVSTPTLFVVAYLSKSIVADYYGSTPFGDQKRIVIQEKTTYAFTRYTTNKNNASTCVAWFSSQPIDVFYAAGTRKQKTAWRASTGRDTYFPGPGWQSYQFVRKTAEPVEIFVRRFSPSTHCGYLGSTNVFPQPITPIDMFTDWFGAERLKPYLRDGRKYKVNPSEVYMLGYNGSKPQTAGQSGRKTPTSANNQRWTTPKKQPARQASGASRNVSLTRSQWVQIQKRLKAVGCDPGKIDGLFGARTKLAIACWQRKIGYQGTGILTLPQARALL